MSSAIGSRFVGSEFVDSNPKAPRVFTNNRSTGPEMRIVGNGVNSLSSQLAHKVEEKVTKARQADLDQYATLIRKSVDSKLTTRETDTLAELVLKLGIPAEQVDADQGDYRYLQSMSGRDLKAESSEAQKVLFAAVEELRVIERETIPQLRKVIANARGRNQQAGYERQKLEQIAAAKPWLVPAPAEVETK